MPDFVEFTDAETAFKKGVGQDFFRKMKDDFTNLNARLLAQEGVVGVSDHFMQDVIANDINPPDHWAASVKEAGTQFDRVTVSELDMLAATGGNDIVLAGQPHLQFDEVVLPLTFSSRQKFSADGGFKIGMIVWSGGQSSDAAGIWLERVDASDWRFVSYDTSRNDGTSFGRITTGNRFNIDIEFTDDPSDRAICKIDGTIKETLITQLPTSKILHCMFGWFPSAATRLIVDRGAIRAGGIVDKPT